MLILLVCFGGVSLVFYLLGVLEASHSNPKDANTDVVAEAVAVTGTTAVQPALPPAPAIYVRPSTAPNGSPWPVNANYVTGYPMENADGYSNVTVDNTQNDSDVFVKLISLAGETATPVRQFYIPARQQFALSQVTAGKYDIRYRNLGDGSLSRSEQFDISESQTDDGVEYSNITMTLYKVQNGNMQTYGLEESAF